MTKKIVHVSGKRKHAVARATLKEGSGIIKVNNMHIDIYQPELARMKIREPIMLAGDLIKKIDIDVNVFGGGWSGQAEAARLAIAKGLVEYSNDNSLKKMFLDYDRHLLVADTRRNEACKPNDSGKPRKKRQKSYR